MLKIQDYEVYPEEKERWGVDPLIMDELYAYNNSAEAKHVFRYLNRPLPEGVRPDELVDCSTALPEMMTVPQMAERAGISVEEALLRMGTFIEDAAGVTDDGEQLFYWESRKKDLTEELLTVNAISERYGIDRRTIKKHIANAKWNISGAIVFTQGSREYPHYWITEVETVLAPLIKEAA